MYKRGKERPRKRWLENIYRRARKRWQHKTATGGNWKERPMFSSEHDKAAEEEEWVEKILLDNV